MKPVRLSLEADSEFTAAKDWYAEIDPFLADRFFQVIRATLKIIERHPEAWLTYDETYRHYPLTNFPYTIFYTILEDCILVDAIAHQSRLPDYWQKDK